MEHSEDQLRVDRFREFVNTIRWWLHGRCAWLKLHAPTIYKLIDEYLYESAHSNLFKVKESICKIETKWFKSTTALCKIINYCGAEISKKAIRCKTCNDIFQQKVSRPTRNELKKLIRVSSFAALGRKFNVSDNTVRKWCKNYGLPFKTSEIKKFSESQWLEM